MAWKMFCNVCILVIVICFLYWANNFTDILSLLWYKWCNSKHQKNLIEVMEARGLSTRKNWRQNNIRKFCSKSQAHIKAEKCMKNKENKEKKPMIHAPRSVLKIAEHITTHLSMHLMHAEEKTTSRNYVLGPSSYKDKKTHEE